MKKSKKIVKIFIMALIVLIAGAAAWLGFGHTTSEASNYSGCPKCIKFDNTNLGWNEVYAYCWDKEGTADIIKFEKSDANTFYGVIPGNKYIKGLFKNTPGTDNWDKQTEDLDLPQGPCTFVFYPTKTDNKVDGTFLCEYYQYVTVLYKNDSFTNPYIYFKVGDSKWTSDYGVKMTKSTTYEGYYEAKILVTKANSVTCCFNNGDNSAWDNNNSANYTLASDHVYQTYKIENGTSTLVK